MARYDIVCVHTIVGFAPAHAAHFSTHHDGDIDQSRDTRYRSAANLHGNHRIIAVENEDHGSAFGPWNITDGHAVPALTDAQVEANAQILAWAHKEHGVPLQLCPDSRPGSRGLAYHRQGIDGSWASYRYGGRVSGGEVWTEHRGKVCPGDRRIAQLPAILARAKQIVEGDVGMSWNENLSPGTPGNDISGMANDIIPKGWGHHAADLLGYAAASLAWMRNRRFAKPYWPDETITLTNMSRWDHSRLRKMEPQIEKLLERTQAILDAVGGADAQTILARIDQRVQAASAERQTLADQLDAMQHTQDELHTLLASHADGSLDEAAVVEGVRALLHAATPPGSDEA